MTRYSIDIDGAKSAKARGSHLRVHFKHMREVSHAIQHMRLHVAKKYLEDVLAYKRAIPFTKYTGGVGRHAQGKLGAVGKKAKLDGKMMKAIGDKCRWPQKATRIVLDLVLNAESNAESKNLDTEMLTITHIQCNRAPQQRRRTYRAHGRINPYMSHPCHIELVLSEKAAEVKKGEVDAQYLRKGLSKRQVARKKLKFVEMGGGVPAAAAGDDDDMPDLVDS